MIEFIIIGCLLSVLWLPLSLSAARYIIERAEARDEARYEAEAAEACPYFKGAVPQITDTHGPFKAKWDNFYDNY